MRAVFIDWQGLDDYGRSNALLRPLLRGTAPHERTHGISSRDMLQFEVDLVRSYCLGLPPSHCIDSAS